MSRRSGVALATALGAVYQLGLRRRILTWGATKAEAASRLPGDELLEHADGVATRSIKAKRATRPRPTPRAASASS
jgi:hypothetical protein